METPEPGPGPGARRRYLGKKLRRLRERADLTVNKVAELMRVTQPTVSRIEGGRNAILARHVAKMLELYGIDGPEADALMRIAEQANERGWWESYSDVIHDWFEIYTSLEADATEVWTYEAEFVPGLFQTPDYVRAVRLAAHPDSTEAQIDRSIALRAERQRHLTGTVVAVINEAVVRRLIAPGLFTQVSRLMTEAADDRLRIIPFTVGLHPAMHGAFSMLRFEDSGEMDLVYTETERGGMYLERPADLVRYGDVFARLKDQSLSPDDTADLLTTLMKE